MGNDDERELTDAELAELVGSEEPPQPVTGPREKAQPSGLLKQHLAWMTKESVNWTPEELARELEQTIEMIVDLQVRRAPTAAQDELRGVMREMMESDPTVSELVKRLRVATR